MLVMFSLILNNIWSLEYSSRDLHCKHTKITWASSVATKPWQMLTKISLQTAMRNSSVGNIGNCESLVCDVNGFQDNMCVIIHHVGGIVS